MTTLDLEAIAELVAKQVLRGEGISTTDVLHAIREATVEISLADWIEGRPSDRPCADAPGSTSDTSCGK